MTRLYSALCFRGGDFSVLFIDADQCSLFVNISNEMYRLKGKYIEQMTVNEQFLRLSFIDSSFCDYKRGNINTITSKYIAVFKNTDLPNEKECECDTKINRAKMSMYVAF